MLAVKAHAKDSERIVIVVEANLTPRIAVSRRRGRITLQPCLNPLVLWLTVMLMMMLVALFFAEILAMISSSARNF